MSNEDKKSSKSFSSDIENLVSSLSKAKGNEKDFPQERNIINKNQYEAIAIAPSLDNSADRSALNLLDSNRALGLIKENENENQIEKIEGRNVNKRRSGVNLKLDDNIVNEIKLNAKVYQEIRKMNETLDSRESRLSEPIEIGEQVPIPPKNSHKKQQLLFKREAQIKQIKEKYSNLREISGNVGALKSVLLCGKVLDVIISFIVAINLMAALLENYLFTSKSDTKPANFPDDKTKLLRYAEAGCSFILILLIIIRYYNYLNELRRKEIASDNDGLLSTGLYKTMLAEMFILAIVSPPFLDEKISGQLSNGYFELQTDSIFTFVICFKSYYPIRLFLVFSKWHNDETLEVARETKITIGFVFALKSSIKQYPFIFSTVMLGITLFFCGFLMRIFEVGFSGAPGKGGNPDFEAYLDSFWLIIITMLTVGYGDMYPNTALGRIVAIITTLSGMVIVSFLIVSLSTWTELTPEEKKSYVLIKRQDAIEKMTAESKAFIRKMMKLLLVKYKRQNELNRMSKYLVKVIKIKEFSIGFSQVFKIAMTHELPSEDVLMQLERKMRKDTEQINGAIEQLKDMGELTQNILEQELQINYTLSLVKKQQEGFNNFLVGLNSKKKQQVEEVVEEVNEVWE